MTDSKPNPHLSLVDAALDLQQAGDYEAALHILKRAQEKAPDYGPIYLLLGMNYQELSQPEQAEANIRKALSLEPDYPEALQALCLVLMEQKRWAEAADLLKKHLGQDPTNRASLQALATALLQLERPEEALPILRQAWLQAGDEKTGLQVGRILVSIKSFEDAEALLREVADQFETPETLADWSAVLAMMGRYSDSIAILNRARDMDAANDRAWRGLAYCHGHLGEFEQALGASEQALALNARHYRNWQIHAEILLRLERPEQALEATWRGIELIEPADTEAQGTLSRLLSLEWRCIHEIAKGKPVEDLLKVFEEGRSRFPTRDMFPQLQASLLISLGRHEEALSVLDDFVADGILPDSTFAVLRYSILHLLGRAVEAWTCVEPFLAVPDLRHHLDVVSYQLRERGEIGAAESVTRQLRAYFADDAGFASSLGFILLGRGSYEEADQHLTFALAASDDDLFRGIILTGLGYSHLVQGNLAQSDTCLRDAAHVSHEDITSTCYVAYWLDDRVVPDYVAHPTRGLLLTRAVSANRVTLALAQGNVKEAAALAQEMVNGAPDDPWGHTMLGWILRAEADWEGARQAWQQAIELTEDEQDRQAIASWLESLPK